MLGVSFIITTIVAIFNNINPFSTSGSGFIIGKSAASVIPGFVIGGFFLAITLFFRKKVWNGSIILMWVIFILIIVLSNYGSDYSGDSAPPFRCKRRHLNWADLFYNINQFFSVFFFRKESPFNSNLCALPDNLSIIASATVFSPIYSYHLLTGICEDINVDRLP